MINLHKFLFILSIVGLLYPPEQTPPNMDATFSPNPDRMLLLEQLCLVDMGGTVFSVASTAFG